MCLGSRLQFLTEFTFRRPQPDRLGAGEGHCPEQLLLAGNPEPLHPARRRYRDPWIWRDGLAMMRDLQPEILLNTHTRPVVGKEEVMKRLTGYMDQITLTFDQTLAAFSAVSALDEIRHEIYYPPHLKEIPENAQSYGENIHFPAAIYQYAVGWFDNDVTELFKIHPDEEAERTGRPHGRARRGGCCRGKST